MVKRRKVPHHPRGITITLLMKTFAQYPHIGYNTILRRAGDPFLSMLLNHNKKKGDTMNYSHYDRFADSVRGLPGLLMLIRLLNIFFTSTGLIMYPALLVFIYYTDSFASLAIHILLPGLAFTFISVYRKCANRQRPYEIYPIHPLIGKEKKGESFPSRHVFSIFLISVLWLFCNPAVGVFMLICAIGLALIRVLGGIHFIRDVVWGAVAGIGAALFTHWILTFI